VQTSLESFTQDDAGVKAVVKNSGGKTKTIEARYLIGCDGANSAVRHALELDFQGSTFERLFYVADVQISWDFGHDGLVIFLMKNELLACFPMPGENRFRIVGTFPQEFKKDEGEVLYEEIEKQIKHDSELDIDITDVNWFRPIGPHTTDMSINFGRPLFLAGDSAHIHSPAALRG